MKRRERRWLALAALLCLLAIGLPYAAIPYDKLSVPSALFPGLWLTGACAAALTAARAHVLRCLLVLGAIAPLVTWLRVVVDTTRDPTSHNLWPIEIVLAFGASALCVLPGALLGMLFLRLRQRARR